MKKQILLLAAAAMLGTSAVSAATDKNINDIRIYINPGHGGWGSGDRHMGTVKHGPADYTDTCGFFETNTNMWKGLATLQRLSEYGFKYDPTLNQKPEGVTDPGYRYGAARDMSQGLVMSHVKLGESRDINEIAREVEANNFDFFISIHSNAATEGSSVNYPAMFIRGENAKESVAGSAAACRTIWPYAYSNTHSQWSNYSMTNVGMYYDIDFWSGDYATTDHGNGNIVKGYYAVLRHNVPGLLCEGYFHTYQPARHRAMNPDVCRIEGEAYARGIADVFGVEKEKTGDIYGIVRDKHQKFKHQFYNAPSSSPDAYLPLNNAVATLYDAQGKVVATYTTDDEYNGAFVFRKLPVGTYTVKVAAQGYKEMSEEYATAITVTEHSTVYPLFWLEDENYEAPAVVARDYLDEIDNPSVVAGSEYAFRTAVDNKAIAQLEGKDVKRMIVRGDKVYVLAHDAQKAATVLVLNATTLDVLSEVSTDGTRGNIYNLADIALTADGVLVGSAAELCFITEDQMEAGETWGECNFYKWENDAQGLPAGAPAKWFSTHATANFYRATTGLTFAYSGTLAEGRIYLPSASTYYEQKVWLNTIDVTDGVAGTPTYVNSTRDHMNMDELGWDYTISVSPLNSDCFIVNSSNVPAMQFNYSGYALESTLGTDVVTPSARAGYFKLAGASMMAHCDVDKDGNQQGVLLRNISAGLFRSESVTATNTAMDAATGRTASAGRTVVVRNSDDEITGANIDLYTIREGKVTRFTTQGTAQPAAYGVFAYGLHSQADGDHGYNLSFTLPKDAEATVELVATADNDTDLKTITVASGTFQKGENTVPVTTSAFNGNYTWKVTVHNPAVPAVNTFFDSEIVSSGVAMDKNPDSDRYGYMYVSQRTAGNKGVITFLPDLTRENQTPYMPNVWDESVGASPWRLCVTPAGKLIVTDWGDAQGGMYLFDPANPAAGRSNFFAGTCDGVIGQWRYNGQIVGGTTTCAAYVGTGEDALLLTMQEDWPAEQNNTVCFYRIGTKEKIDFQPETTSALKALTNRLINGNVDMLVAEGKGMIAGQVRGGGNNTSAVPVFLVTDNKGEIVFNSGDDWESLTGGVGMIALNDSADKFVVQNDGTTAYVCDIQWEPEFKLTPRYSFDVLQGGGSTKDTFQATFDPAGNLYIANRSSMRGISLPREKSDAVTPARSTDVLAGVGGVGEISVDADSDSNAPVHFYNLQGVEMPDGNLAPGIYIRRQGNQATKIIVK